jgi:hypothetical protein
MDKAAEVKKALKEILNIRPNLPLTATVVKIQGDTCTVKLLSGLEISEVRLKAVDDDESDRLVLIPKEGSQVLIMSQTGELSGLFVIKVNKVKSIIYKQNGFEFKLESESKKLTLKNEDASLYDVFNELCALIKTLKVFTPSGVSGVPIPTTIAKINQVETKFKRLLNKD